MSVLPLYLSLRQTHVLAVAVGLQIQADSAIVLDEEGAQGILTDYGPSGAARADQVRAAARQRLPVLRELRERLVAHGVALEHMQVEGEER